MNYLLFQPAILTEPDAVYKNGTLLSNSDERGKAYDEIVNLSLSTGNSQYPWVGKVDGFFFVRGLFDATDEKGRTLSFLFASNNESFKDELESVSATIGYAIKDETRDAIYSFKKKSNRTIKVLLASIFCGLLLCFILFIIKKCS